MSQDSVRELKPFQIFSEGLAIDADFTPKPIEVTPETQAPPAVDSSLVDPVISTTATVNKAETLVKVAKD